ncbi:MAG: phosphopantothenoylcysteine decarboxylase [Candidatus Omnitrophota bacterium]|nr:phosphopantothenoylcysteine decarboxylase [Candidatus Omnitrophota bacterium]
MSLRNKRILITAGPTWIPIDSVRVISNISSGETGILIAENALRQGARVTLLLGPAVEATSKRFIKIIRFRFFNELLNLLTYQLQSQRFHAVIHLAAVSDYKLKNKIKAKLKSGISKLKLDLVPTQKIINRIKKIAPKIFLVGFKLEPKATILRLIKSADNLFKYAKVDLAVVNVLDENKYFGFILNNQIKILAKVISRRDLALKLIRILDKEL